MSLPVWRQMTGVMSASSRPESTKILLRLQILLAKTDLSMLSVAHVLCWACHHAAIMLDSLHWWLAMALVNRRRSKVLVAGRELPLVASRREDI